VKFPAGPPEIARGRKEGQLSPVVNNPWRVVEPAGQVSAGDGRRRERKAGLTILVRYAHQKGLRIRFYTLD